MESYKLQVKVGLSEFLAEGQETKVREDFDKFLAAVNSLAPTNGKTINGAAGAIGNASSSSTSSQESQPVDRTILDRIFSIQGDTLSLRLLPPDGDNRIGDAIILLLYGFRILHGIQDVPVTKLTSGVRVSGIAVQRLDRFIGSHMQFMMKGGTRSGGRYTLNNQGVAHAETLLKQYFNS